MPSTSPSNTAKINLKPDNHPAQEAFVNSKSDEVSYVGGVGSGKTTGGVFRSARNITEWNIGHMGAVVSPTVPMLRNVIIPELEKAGLLDERICDYKRSENRIEYTNGSTVILESANNDRKIERLRGLNLAWAWIDEAAYVPEKVYTILNDRLRSGDYRNIYITTTPRGYNWVYDEFGEIDGKTDTIADGSITKTENKTSIVGVSTKSNPANPEDYIDRQERKHTGETYNQEIQGEFVKFEGLVYKWFDRNKHVINTTPEHYDEVIYGIDWGHNNPAVVLVLLRNGSEWLIADEYYERRQTTGDQASAAERLVNTYGEGPLYCDPSEPSNIHEFTRDYGLPAKAADNAVTPGIRKISELQDRLYIRDICTATINEFGQYQYKEDDTRDKPVKEHDHAMDALRYALYTHMNTDGLTRRKGTAPTLRKR